MFAARRREQRLYVPRNDPGCRLPARVLLGSSQAVEIVQHFGAAGIEIEIELSATAELEQVQTDPPPDEKPLVVDDQGQKPGVRHAIEPLIELRPEVTNGCRE